MANYGYSVDQCAGFVSNVSSDLGRQRHFYTEPQLALLEAEFTAEPFPNKDARHRIALRLGVADKSVMWWYQNRRRRARQQVKQVGGSSSSIIRTRSHRRSSPYTSYQSEPNGSLRSSYSANDPSSWSAWSYPVIENNLMYSNAQPANYYSVSSVYKKEPSYPVERQLDWIPSSVAVDQTNQNFVPSTDTTPFSQHYQRDLPEFQHHQQAYFGNFTNTGWDYSPPFNPGSYPSQEAQEPTTNYSDSYFCYSTESESHEYSQSFDFCA